MKVFSFVFIWATCFIELKGVRLKTIFVSLIFFFTLSGCQHSQPRDEAETKIENKRGIANQAQSFLEYEGTDISGRRVTLSRNEILRLFNELRVPVYPGKMKLFIFLDDSDLYDGRARQTSLTRRRFAEEYDVEGFIFDRRDNLPKLSLRNARQPDRPLTEIKLQLEFALQAPCYFDDLMNGGKPVYIGATRAQLRMNMPVAALIQSGEDGMPDSIGGQLADRAGRGIRCNR